MVGVKMDLGTQLMIIEDIAVTIVSQITGGK